jgi:hypothetical protein
MGMSHLADFGMDIAANRSRHCIMGNAALHRTALRHRSMKSAPHCFSRNRKWMNSPHAAMTRAGMEV